MTFDKIEKVGASELHHGRINDRVYLTRLHEKDLDTIFEKVEQLASQQQYGKIVSKVPRWALETFLERGYRVEAEIPGLFKGSTNGYFLAGYPKKQRVFRPEKEERFIESVKTIALATSDASPKIAVDGFEVRSLEEADLPKMAHLAEKVFSTYPYPIYDPEYLKKCQQEEFEFYGIFQDHVLLEAAIVKANREEGHSEIIDFVIPSQFKGQNLAYHILGEIKRATAEQELHTLYSSVRATSYGLNITFRKQGFQYGGTLINNTWVGNHLESMNIWYLNQ